LMMEALSSSETSALTRAIQRNILGDAILQREDCKDLYGTEQFWNYLSNYFYNFWSISITWPPLCCSGQRFLAIDPGVPISIPGDISFSEK
jgi:hypothetical protein